MRCCIAGDAPVELKWWVTVFQEEGHMAVLACLQLQLEGHIWPTCDYVISWPFVLISCEPWLDSMFLDTFSAPLVPLSHGWVCFQVLQPCCIRILSGAQKYLFSNVCLLLSVLVKWYISIYVSPGRQTSGGWKQCYLATRKQKRWVWAS